MLGGGKGEEGGGWVFVCVFVCVFVPNVRVYVCILVRAYAFVT